MFFNLFIDTQLNKVSSSLKNNNKQSNLINRITDLSRPKQNNNIQKINSSLLNRSRQLG